MEFNGDIHIINVEAIGRQKENIDYMKKLRDHFDKLYYEKNKEKVCPTYHSTWNDFLTFLFCCFPNLKYQKIMIHIYSIARPQYTSKSKIKEFYKEIVVKLMISNLSIKIVAYGLDKLIKAEKIIC